MCAFNQPAFLSRSLRDELSKLQTLDEFAATSPNTPTAKKHKLNAKTTSANTAASAAATAASAKTLDLVESACVELKASFGKLVDAVFGELKASVMGAHS